MAVKPEGVVALIAQIREKVNRFILQELDYHGIQGLAPSHGDILATLFQETVLPMGELARMIDRDKSTVTTLVDKLIALDYVEKVKDDPDSRVTLVKLTEQGKALKPDFEEISARLLSKVYEGISAEEQQGLVALLSRIRNNF